jgi:hypothetical protein
MVAVVHFLHTLDQKAIARRKPFGEHIDTLLLVGYLDLARMDMVVAVDTKT